MAIINVVNMHCQGCANRIAAALHEKGITAEVSAQARTVTVPDKEVYKAKEAIVAVGYAIAGEKDDSR